LRIKIFHGGDSPFAARTGDRHIAASDPLFQSPQNRVIPSGGTPIAFASAFAVSASRLFVENFAGRNQPDSILFHFVAA